MIRMVTNKRKEKRRSNWLLAKVGSQKKKNQKWTRNKGPAKRDQTQETKTQKGPGPKETKVTVKEIYLCHWVSSFNQIFHK